RPRFESTINHRKRRARYGGMRYAARQAAAPAIQKAYVPMPRANPDLHGNAPDKSDVALLLIDVINDLEFEGGDALLQQAVPLVATIAALKPCAKALGIPVIYVNDNFGRWRSDFKAQVDHCLKDGVRGRPLAEALRPEKDDYFVLKPKHSGFYSTSLAILLDHLRA